MFGLRFLALVAYALIAVLAFDLSAGGFVIAGGGRDATPPEAPTVADRVIVVFQAQAVPADATARVAGAGGTVVLAFDSVGVLVAEAVATDGATLIRRLRADPAILAADFDRVLDLIAPASVDADEGAAAGAETHLPHPLPTFSSALPADFFYTSSPQQWSVKRIGARGGGVPGSGGPGAWDLTFGSGAKIAILDTGVNAVHPDVAPNLIFNATLTSYSPDRFGTPNCEVPDPANPPFDLPADQHGHGTWTSSLAAGAIGGGLVIGVAPQAKILNIKVLRARRATAAELTARGVQNTPFDQCRFRGGRGLFSWVLGGILLANEQSADVISMSLGGFVPRNVPGGAGAALWSAFNRVTNFVTSNGSVVVAAVGNVALDLDNLGSLVHLPSDSPSVIAVTATTNPALLPPTPPQRQPCAAAEDCLAFYSNFGSSLHGLAAPGGDRPAGGCAFTGTPCIPTGFVRGACSSGVPGTTAPVPLNYPASGPPPAGKSWGCFTFLEADQHAWYVQATGTSASAPHVAGAAALVKGLRPELRPNQIRTILQQTAQDIGRVGYDELFNFGLVDAAAATAAAAQP